MINTEISYGASGPPGVFTKRPKNASAFTKVTSTQLIEHASGEVFQRVDPPDLAGQNVKEYFIGTV